jgi:hypothetical protein
MIVHEVPNNSGDVLDVAYRFIAEPQEGEADAMPQTYRRLVNAHCLGAMIEHEVNLMDGGRLLHALEAPETVTICNRDRATYERVVRYAYYSGYAGLRQERDLLADLGVQDEDVTLGRDEHWVTKDNLSAYSPCERWGDRLIARNYGSIDDLGINKYGALVAQTVADLGLTHYSVTLDIRDGIYLGDYFSLGRLIESGEYAPYLTLANPSTG